MRLTLTLLILLALPFSMTVGQIGTYQQVDTDSIVPPFIRYSLDTIPTGDSVLTCFETTDFRIGVNVDSILIVWECNSVPVYEIVPHDRLFIVDAYSGMFEPDSLVIKLWLTQAEYRWLREFIRKQMEE